MHSSAGAAQGLAAAHAWLSVLLVDLLLCSRGGGQAGAMHVKQVPCTSFQGSGCWPCRALESRCAHPAGSLSRREQAQQLVVVRVRSALRVGAVGRLVRQVAVLPQQCPLQCSARARARGMVSAERRRTSPPHLPAGLQCGVASGSDATVDKPKCSREPLAGGDRGAPWRCGCQGLRKLRGQRSKQALAARGPHAHLPGALQM